MIWQKEKGTGNSRNLDYLLIAIILFFLIAVIFNQPLLFAVIGIMLSYLVMTKLYDYFIGRKLSIQNQRMSMRLFPGDHTLLKFQLDNRSSIPYINGHFKFQLDNNIQVNLNDVHILKHEQSVQLPLSVMSKTTSTIDIPIVAKSRGTTKIKNIQYEFPNLFSFTSSILKYVPYYYSEYIVFPKLKKVEGLSHYFQYKAGEQQVLLSPYEDILSPYGTRDYHFDDPFHKINWKASAKTQSLQTHVYEHVLDQSLLIVVNLGLQNGNNMTQINPMMEELLSYAAYITKYATEENIPFEVVVNVRKPGKIPYLQMKQGGGKDHYARTLELLARIPKQPLIMPINQVVYQTMKHTHEPQTVIMVGECTPMKYEVVNHLPHKHLNMLSVEHKDGKGIIKQMAKGVSTHET